MDETILPKTINDSFKQPRYGSAPIYIINGVPTPVAQDIHNAYRGPHLKHLSFYEYVGIVSILKKEKIEQKSKTVSSGRGSNVIE